MNKLLLIVKEIKEKLEAKGQQYTNASIEEIIEYANFFEDQNVLFEKIYITSKVSTNKKVIEQMATITIEKLQEANVTNVIDYMLSIHPSVVQLEDGQTVYMMKPKATETTATA